MVLQRDMILPLWGWDQPGQKISVTFAEKTYQATTDKNGKWRVELEAQKPGGPFQMTIQNGTEALTYKNILVGDVWLCSGQSNMAWIVANSKDAAKEIKMASDDYIRQFKVPLEGSKTLSDRLPGGSWVECSPETVGEFTAVGYFFARHLRNGNRVPIGLINSSWGGSSIEAWTRAGAELPQEVTDIIERNEKEQQEAIQKLTAQLEKDYGQLPKTDAGIKDGKPLWIGSSYDDSDWKTMVLPQLWEDAGLQGLDGWVWFRKTIELNQLPKEGSISLGLSKIDDSDQVWVNDQLVGGMTQAYNTVRQYEVPIEALKVGKNTITVRVEDTGGGGGIYGDPANLYLDLPGQSISLSGEWKYKVSAYLVATNQRINQTPSMLYNRMIHPMIGYPIKGAIWYQGESNAGGERAFTYRYQFPAMIKDWRKQWEQGDFPFLFVQLANFMPPSEQPEESDWAVLRESQSKTLETSPNTAQAVIIDIGEANDIHPRNKQDVGFRLGLAAEKLAYQKNIVHSGPVYKAMTKKGNQIILSFDHVGSGLKAKDKYGYLKGFTIAGEDKAFQWAQAVIDGDRIIVSSPKIADPVAVRYAWANNPDDANLYNQEDLPASPFRTDEW